ncbi:UNVERIFIED_CONTAM: hypothetical protein PYX00_003375 [Menopon gallinae]|uniref:Uncharacterized protein n=1 Tax=Menopon gallinae TaxID=328185 RepID=A0AAW2I0T6_9NEOP
MTRGGGRTLGGAPRTRQRGPAAPARRIPTCPPSARASSVRALCPTWSPSGTSSTPGSAAAGATPGPSRRSTASA